MAQKRDQKPNFVNMVMKKCVTEASGTSSCYCACMQAARMGVWKMNNNFSLGFSREQQISEN